MDLEMVLNELSMRFPASDIYVARQRMVHLIETVLQATTHGVKRTLRTHSDFNGQMLAPDYPVVRWSNDSSVDRELRRFFRTLVTKSPFLEDITDVSIQNTFYLSESFHNGETAVGFGVAFWLEGLAISLSSEKRWNTNNIQLKVIQLDNNDEMLETEALLDIPHASIKEHVGTHQDWIAERLRKAHEPSFHSGTALWENKETLFPHLFFCEKVATNLHNLSHGNSLLIPVVNRLHELENFCKEWYDGPFDSTKISSKVTNESEATMEMFGDDRTFLCHDGIFRAFRWHVRLTPGAWRLYFYPMQEEKRLIIGYIGPHLPTVNFSH